MNIDNIFKRISEDKLDLAIKEMALFLDYFSSMRRNLTQLRSRLSYLKNAKMKGVLERANINLEKNQISEGLINIINKLENKINESSGSISPSNYTLKEFEENLMRSLERKYDIVKRIPSSSTSAILYKVKEISTEKIFAIRCITSPNLATEKVVMGNDVRKVLKLRHRNLLKLIDVPRNSYPPCLIREYISGYDLESKVKHVGPFTFRETLEIILKLTDAVHYLHQRNMRENELYPDRILMDEEGEPLLAPQVTYSTDQRILSQEKVTEYFLYLSPEQIQSYSFTGEKESNQFTLGTLAFFLLTGTNLFKGAYWFEIMEDRKRFFADEALRKNRLSILKKKKAPDLFINIILKLLEREPENRFNNFYNLKKELLDCEIETSEDYNILKDSYYRCLANNSIFLKDLYKDICENSKEAKERFRKKVSAGEQNLTEKHSAILHHSMIMIIESTPDDQEYIDYLIQHKDKYQLSDDYYNVFFDVLMKKLEKDDFEWEQDERIEKTWKKKKLDIMEYIKNNLGKGKKKL